MKQDGSHHQIAICCCLDLELPASRTTRGKFLLFLSHLVSGLLVTAAALTMAAGGLAKASKQAALSWLVFSSGCSPAGLLSEHVAGEGWEHRPRC